MTHSARPPQRLRWNFFWMLAGNSVYAASLWGILVALAKITSAEEVGRFTLGLAITAPVFLMLNLQLRALQATDARGDFPFSVYFSVRLVGALASFVICAGIAAVVSYPTETRLVILALAFARVFQALSDVIHGLFQRREQMARIATYRILKGVGYLAAVSATVAVGRDISEAAAGYAAVALAGFVILDLRSARRIEPVGWYPHGRELFALFRTALPLGFVMMMINLNGNVPIYFLAAEHGERAVGIYSAINYVGVAGTTVVGALAQAAAPRLAQFHTGGQRGAFRALLHRLVGLGLLIGALAFLVALLAGEQVLALLYSAEFAAHAEVFVVLMVAYGFSYSSRFLGLALTARREFRVLVPINAVALVANAGLCWALVPQLGLLGGAYAFTAAAFLKFIANYAIALRR